MSHSHFFVDPLPTFQNEELQQEEEDGGAPYCKFLRKVAGEKHSKSKMYYGKENRTRQWSKNNKYGEQIRGTSKNDEGGYKQSGLEEQFQKNETKIQNLSLKLDQLYSHYKTQKTALQPMKQKILQLPHLKLQNHNIQSQLTKISSMVKSALIVDHSHRGLHRDLLG